MTDRKTCECPGCVYGLKIRDLIERTPDATDKALIRELYENLIQVEDDRDFHSIMNQGCKIKHGGISFTDACHAVDARRSSEKGEPRS